MQATRVRPMSWQPARPSVALIARELGLDASRSLALLAPLLAARAGGDEIAVYVSEPMASIYGIQSGDTLALPITEPPLKVRVRGVWRDYARQFGAVAIDLADYRRATGDMRVNDLALWLAPGASPADTLQRLRALGGDALPLEGASTGELRAISLSIFDRSFAVTRYLQMVAIAVGLVGIAASLSAQVLARRKEFGLLAHLGLTRAQVLALVAGEAAAWMAAGALLGLALGIAVSVVLVKVVNPQSFHWTMDLLLPWGPLALLVTAVLAAGVATALVAGRRATGRDMVLAVKEDW
jgi:putative ABC transport system permease protein